MREKPKFFCETCGREVPVDLDYCPYCGMRFYGVMCPRCGYSGVAAEFKSGCPRCGYRSAAPRNSSQGSMPVLTTQDIHGNTDREEQGSGKRRGSLWAPLLVIILLASLAGGFVLLLLR
ncbi:MAG TPA: zinc ribbon domain-containing protein [Sediminispirochaeta sp.]|nr:zinc ribbon domain-containing protein [Sediminispirochaeta sp.]